MFMKEVVVERFDGLPQALHSRLNAQPAKRRGRSTQWIALSCVSLGQKDESFPLDWREDRLACHRFAARPHEMVERAPSSRQELEFMGRSRQNALEPPLWRKLASPSG
jgi:hypothetical protein